MYLANLMIVALSTLFVQTQAQFKEYVLVAHNKFRGKHGCPTLKLDATLNAECQSYAETLASNDKMAHSSGNYGENLCYVTSDPVSCVKMWYDEEKLYNYDKAQFSLDTGHFTQLIWKASIKMGVGQKKSASQKIYVVARYIPAGNVQGAFKSNVPKPLNSNGYKASISKYFALFLCIFLTMFY